MEGSGYGNRWCERVAKSSSICVPKSREAAGGVLGVCATRSPRPGRWTSLVGSGRTTTLSDEVYIHLHLTVTLTEGPSRTLLMFTNQIVITLCLQ